jgi:hypothetical protein
MYDRMELSNCKRAGCEESVNEFISSLRCMLTVFLAATAYASKDLTSNKTHHFVDYFTLCLN